MRGRGRVKPFRGRGRGRGQPQSGNGRNPSNASLPSWFKVIVSATSGEPLVTDRGAVAVDTVRCSYPCLLATNMLLESERKSSD